MTTLCPCHREQHLEPLPAALLHRPLEFLLAEHHRQRVLCVLCEQIAAAGTPDADLIREVIAYLVGDMMLHVIDEEQDLFPLIRRRAEAGDDIEPALGHLSGQHAAGERHAATLIAGLNAALEQPDQPLAEGLRQALCRFARDERRHLALENATVMPLAKLRLTPRDLEDLGARMAARRGILFDRASSDAAPGDARGSDTSQFEAARSDAPRSDRPDCAPSALRPSPLRHQ